MESEGGVGERLRGGREDEEGGKGMEERVEEG